MCSSSDLRNWPIFSLLEPEFILQIHMVAVYGNLINFSTVIFTCVYSLIYCLVICYSCIALKRCGLHITVMFYQVIADALV